MPKPNVQDILNKYSSQIRSKINGSTSSQSQDYLKFRAEMIPVFTRYEKWCHSLGQIIKLKVSEKDRVEMKRHLDIAHLNVEPWQALGLSMMAFVAVFVLGLLLSVGTALIKGSVGAFPWLFFFLSMILSLFLFYFVKGYPRRIANQWRLKASSQMVPAILYIVVYMRHTPNFEKAVSFAADNLQPPLALDLKKVFYNVQLGKFSTLKESLDNYLETWRDYSTEFIEAFHLIEGSLFEPSNDRRISTLEKALQVVLDGVYDKMLRFTHNVRSPLTNVYMLGVVLPTLGLALLPLASAMIGDFLKWHHVFILFNLIVPFLVFYLTDKIMLLRPGGYGETEFLERNPLYSKYKSKKSYVTAFLICLPLLIIGFLPLIFQFTPLPDWVGLQQDYAFSDFGLTFFGDSKLFGFVEAGSGVSGPFGMGALLLGMFIPLGIALFFSLGARSRTKELIKEREKTRQLETEFNNSLFQLGNRIGNGTPPELVFSRVAESSKGLMTEDFFKRVNYNIQQMGMSVENAIFDERRGAISYYPSDLIATSMRILVESAKKGLRVAAVSLMSISEYVKNIQKITSRLRDMLAEIVSDMKSNMTFLAPLLSGVVVGLAAMITAILMKLNLAELAGSDTVGLGNLETILNIFDLTKMIPPYYLQIAIGIYIIQVIFILTSTLVVVDSGEDKLEKTNKIGKNLVRGVVLYFITAAMATFLLFILTSIVLGNL
jgi:hypothetical protein